MSRPTPAIALVLVASSLLAGGVWIAGAVAQPAAPEPDEGATLTLIEHADNVHEIDVGEPGPSIGDMLVWGADPLYDASDSGDTGATTQGTCVIFNDARDCIVSETILFPDGSTLEFQGIELGGGMPSSRTIVGGSGRYLGATGTMAVTPSEDLSRWTKVIELVP